MYGLREQATELMALPSGDGETTPASLVGDRFLHRSSWAANRMIRERALTASLVVDR
jgi:hypothetical protein